MINTDHKKEWIEFALKNIMPKIAEVTRQKVLGYHGLIHTEEVVMFGIDYALAINQDPLPVILACALHDCARDNDNYDKVHGPRCVPIARKFLEKHDYGLSAQTKQRILNAIENHTIGKASEVPDYIAACLWDADRTRLSWERGFKPQFFSTERALETAAYSKEEQLIYKRNRTFLLSEIETPSLLGTRKDEAVENYTRIMEKQAASQRTIRERQLVSR